VRHDPADVLMVEDDPGDALIVHLAAGALAEAGGGWVGRGQDKQDPANSESMT
jgi:hypothetical protein